MTNTREELIRAVQAVTWNASNYPAKAQPHILGQDIVPLTMKIVDAVEAVFEQALTPTDDERRAVLKAVNDAIRASNGKHPALVGMAVTDAVLALRRPVQGEPTDAWAGRARRAEAALLRVRDIHIATMEALSETFSAVAVPEQGENR